MDQKWKQAYDEIVRQEEEKESGSDSQPSPGSERRAKPRFRLNSGYVWIKVQPRFSVLDVSASGIALFSDFPFEVDQFISITLGKALKVDAEVVECELMVSDEAMLETKYLVRCRFENEEVGTQFLVMIKETDNLNMEMSGKVAPPEN